MHVSNSGIDCDVPPVTSSVTSPSSAPCILPLPSQPTPVPPAFLPRDDYTKLLFRCSPSVETNLRWLSEVNKDFGLDRSLAEVKMSAVTSRFVYIFKRRTAIIDSVTKGEYLSLFLDVQD
ncbi:hypothetical protein E2C01_070762 [Portunus trituberculatus]|uniref:Uncharacterized protein n=1 Tax=Portunus trituberculatus TaxID=210409 RepID=A0A5B7HY67_PORTR|nr:hypothetical protein [Portunus trituberculatus]